MQCDICKREIGKKEIFYRLNRDSVCYNYELIIKPYYRKVNTCEECMIRIGNKYGVDINAINE